MSFKDNIQTRFWRLWYWRPRSGYYYIRNRFFKRYDLIRTGLKKSEWWDKDHLMLEGMMGLLVDYCEKEDGIYFVEGEAQQNRVKRRILRLYIEWKYCYPRTVQDESDALDAWAKTSEMCNRPYKENYTEVYFTYENGYTEEESSILLDKSMAAEAAVTEHEQKLLMRLVKLRPHLWS